MADIYTIEQIEAAWVGVWEITGPGTKIQQFIAELTKHNKWTPQEGEVFADMNGVGVTYLASYGGGMAGKIRPLNQIEVPALKVAIEALADIGTCHSIRAMEISVEKALSIIKVLTK